MKKLTPRPPKKTFITDEQALRFPSHPTPGKLALKPTKPMATQRDLSLAYSPGVAVPVEEIAKDKDLAYDYTSKGNMVAVILTSKLKKKMRRPLSNVSNGSGIHLAG